MSDITAITAGIGGGKSLLATQKIFKELLHGRRGVVTNSSLILEQVRYDYFTVTKEPLPENRIRLIDLEQTKRWWLYVPGRDLTCIEDVAKRQETNEAILYVLDEFHLVYPARDWAKTAKEIGPDVETYVSQLRKVNDELIWITQHREKVDKNFRRNTTEWCVVKNLGKARLFLGVGLPDKFVASYYPQEPVGKDKPEYTTYYNRIVNIRGSRIDYGKQYRTMGGIGFSGNREPEEKPKRMHWSVWLVAAGVCVALAIIVPRFFSNGLGWVLGTSSKNVTESFKKAAGVKEPATKQSAPVAAAVGASPGGGGESRPVPAPPGTNVVYVTGWDLMAGYIRCIMSDGTFRRAERLNSGMGALIGGEYYPIKVRPTEKEYVPQEPPTYIYEPITRKKEYRIDTGSRILTVDGDSY